MNSWKSKMEVKKHFGEGMVTHSSTVAWEIPWTEGYKSQTGLSH